MNRYDRAMRAIWTSPWTAALSMVVCGDGFLHQHGWQRWVFFGSSIWSAGGLVTRGGKRWGGAK